MIKKIYWHHISTIIPLKHNTVLKKNIGKNEKAKQEIKKLFESGLSFEYDFDYNAMNKLNLAINKDGYTIKDIISKLKQGEKIIFMLNDGQTWNGKSGNDSKFLYNKKYDGSIYWEHKIYGDLIRVDSDMGTLQEWNNEIRSKFT